MAPDDAGDAGSTATSRRTRFDDVLVIIPAFNEEAALPATLAGLRAALPGIATAVVDDGSRDRTAEVAASLGTTVLRLPFNLGIGGALQTGFRYAVRNGYRVGVQFDADGQHDPSSIASLVEAVREGADLAVGSRFATTTHRYEVGRMRAGAMGVLRFAIRQLSGERFSDTSSGFRAFSLPMLEHFAEHYPDEYMESVEALLMASTSGFAVREVPVVMHERQDGAPSQQRLRLAYHFLRLLMVLAVSAPRRGGSRARIPAGSPS